MAAEEAQTNLSGWPESSESSYFPLAARPGPEVASRVRDLGPDWDLQVTYLDKDGIERHERVPMTRLVADWVVLDTEGERREVRELSCVAPEYY